MAVTAQVAPPALKFRVVERVTGAPLGSAVTDTGVLPPPQSQGKL